MDDPAATTDLDTRLRALTPTPWALYLMVALNFGVWAANLLDGMSPIAPLSSDLLRWGANSPQTIVGGGQYWRLLTAAFLHSGATHLALNMVGLWSAGPLVNRLYGNAQCLLIYLGSALVANATSVLFAPPQSLSVGASGAVFGVLGALIVAVFQQRGRLPIGTGKNILATQGAFVLYSLGQGFSHTGTDNAAHVGGLVAGGLMAWVLVERLDDQATITRRALRVAEAVGLLAAGLVLLLGMAGVH